MFYFINVMVFLPKFVGQKNSNLKKHWLISSLCLNFLRCSQYVFYGWFTQIIWLSCLLSFFNLEYPLLLFFLIIEQFPRKIIIPLLSDLSDFFLNTSVFQLVTCFFIFLTVSLERQKILILIKFNYGFFILKFVIL